MAPYVKVKVGGSAGEITVGNNSNPPNNHAVIKSFKYGSTSGGGGGGLKMEVEVADEAGGSFATFLSKIISVQDFKKITGSWWLHAEWGWIGTRCPGDQVYPSTKHTMGLQKIATTFTHGLMKFTLEGIDVTAQASEGAIDKSYGTDKDPMPLKTAINLLCVKHSVKVYFWRPNTKEEWEFGDPNKGGKGDKNYPKGVWRENSQNLIQTIMNWIAPYKTDKDKGVTPSFNSKRPPGSQEELILWEGFAPRCGEIVDPCDPKVTIGTYIVNGSKFSPVISFNPTFNWHFGAINQSGGASSQVSNQQKPEQGIPNCDFGKPDHVQKGNPTFNPVTDDAIRIYGTKRALTATQNSQAEHARANISANSISAELKVQGDPLLADPIFLTGKFCSVIFINPFHIQKTSTCGDWLQAEPCNSMLSNRAWIVLGSYHEIREGSYTTTIKLQLPAPGVDISVGEPLGADPKGGKIN
jgi:hypothetical protein